MLKSLQQKKESDLSKQKKQKRLVPFSKELYTPATKKRTKQAQKESSSSKESEDKTNLIKKHKIKFTVKRDWAGKRNYLPTDQTFESYIPEGLNEADQNKSEELVEERKSEIANDLKRVFGMETAVKKAACSNRIRLRFACPVKSCSFETVDIRKHLILECWSR